MSSIRVAGPGASKILLVKGSTVGFSLPPSPPTAEFVAARAASQWLVNARLSDMPKRNCKAGRTLVGSSAMEPEGREFESLRARHSHFRLQAVISNDTQCLVSTIRTIDFHMSDDRT